jgi:regulator of protease activity HflC (stomatin/prohibitin superfamily)
VITLTPEGHRIFQRAILGLVLGVLILMLVSCGVEVVETGHRGVKTHFGKVVSESLPEGLYFYLPFVSDIQVMDTRVLKWASKTQAYTRDVQQADVEFVLTYRLDPKHAHIVFQEVGRDWSEKLVGQVIQEEIKREFGQHEAVNLIAHRDEAARSIEKTARVTLATRNVIVNGLQITNIDYTDVFEHSVEAKVVAQQKAIEEQNRTVQIQEQAKQKVETARGQADSTVLRAKAESESIRLRGQALRENPLLIEWQTIIEWDGVLPKYVMGNSVPLIKLPEEK